MKISKFLIALLFFSNSYSQNEDLITYNPDKQYSQEYIDSLISILRVSVKKKITPEELKKMLESNPKLKGWTYYYFGKAITNMLRNKNFDSSLYYADKGIDKYNRLEVKTKSDNEDYMMLNYVKGDSHMSLRNYREAIVHHQKALDLSKDFPFKFSKVFKAGIAEGHYSIGNKKIALEYFVDISKDTSYMSIPRGSVSINDRLGDLYSEFGDFEKSEMYYLRSLKVSDSTNYKNGFARVSGNLGSLYEKLNKKDLAINNYMKAVSQIEEIGLNNLFESQENYTYYKAYLKFHEGKLNASIDGLKAIITSLSNAKKKTWQDDRLMRKSLVLLASVYKKQKNYSEYEEVIGTAFSFLDSYQQEQLKINLQEIETKYQTKEKDVSISQLEENKQQQGKIIKQQRIITFGLGGLLLLLSGLGYLFWRQRKLVNQYEKENLEQRLLRSQMNPHFVSNALNTVCALVEKKSDKTIPYINKLAGLFRLTLNNSREEFIGLDEEITAIQNYLDLQSNLSDDFSFDISIDESIDPEGIIVPPMLIQPFVENAIIHGIKQKQGKGEIQIVVSKDDKTKLLECKISDNGVGYTESITNKLGDNHKSVSGSIVKERLAILKKKFKVNTHFKINNLTKNEGTLVELYLPFFL